MSQDDVAIAIQSCVSLFKEVQRRVDSAPSASIDAELKQNLKLAKLAVLRATKKEVVLDNSSELTDASSSSFSQAAKSDGKRGGARVAAPQPTALRASFDPTVTNKQRNDIFKSAPLWSVVLCGFQWNKRKLSEQSLTTLQHLLRCKAVNLELYTTLFLSPYTGSSTSNTTAASGSSGHNGSFPIIGFPPTAAGRPGGTAGDASNSSSNRKALCRVGEAVFLVLGEYLATASEPAIQTRLLHILEVLIEGRGQAFFVARTVTRTIHAAYAVALQTTQEAVRAKSQHFLQLCVVRVTKGFVLESARSASGPSGFMTGTMLEDYTVDVEFDAPFTRIEVLERRGTTGAAAAPPLPDPDESGVGGGGDGGAGGNPTADGSNNTRSLDPSLSFPSSLDENTVREAIGVLGPEAQLPQLMKDLIALIRSTCRLATRPLTGSLTEGNVEVRARQLALRMLERLFHELPVANSEAEHRCATWLSLALTACKYDLMRALVRNFGVVAPFAFFESSLHILSLTLRKCHYHMARELHSLLAVYLLPLARSPYCDFRRKHAVLSMVHELFSIPHVLVSFFINYDCSPTFDAGGLFGGMLELLVDFVVDLTFADIVALDGDEGEDWLNSDQQQLLRGECVVALHTLVQSMYRWIAEDPQAYALSLREARRDQAGTKDEWAELYLDNWASSEDEEAQDAKGGEKDKRASGEDGATVRRLDSETASSMDGFATPSFGRNPSFAPEQPTGAVVPHWGRHHNILYHWKHIHYLMHNKRIALGAVELINAGKWKEAKDFLESRRYIPTRKPSAAEVEAMTSKDVSAVPPGESSYAELARFVSQYPGISRTAISGIFDRINKDPASRLLLRDYLHLFRYQGVPIDIAMRDTTCKFMSWDRPMFEAQVWETIQSCFGEEYAQQNPAVISAKDADTMAGVLLFLHSNLHNDMAKGSRFVVDQFATDANACLDMPMEPSELHAMFVRVQRRKWELDPYGRTPAEAERASTVPSLSFKVITEKLMQDQARRVSESARRRQEDAQRDGNEDGSKSADAADAESMANDVGSKAAPSSAKPTAVMQHKSHTSATSDPPPSSPTNHLYHALSKGDVTLLDPASPSYCDGKDNVKLREDQHIAFTRAAGLYAEKLEALHRCFAADRDSYHPQPYAVPHYAEHVRPMLLFHYPSVMACVYMGLRVLEAAPLSRQLLDIAQILYDIAAAFVVNLGDMHDAVTATIQRCLSDDHAYRLTPPTRATFVPFLLNMI